MMEMKQSCTPTPPHPPPTAAAYWGSQWDTVQSYGGRAPPSASLCPPKQFSAVVASQDELQHKGGGYKGGGTKGGGAVEVQQCPSATTPPPPAQSPPRL